MKILFLTQVLPYPLDAGPKVRAYHMLRRLAVRHDVTLASFVRKDDTADAVAHLREMGVQVYTVPMRRSALRNVAAGVKGLLTGLPIVVARDEMGEMFGLLERLAARHAFHVVHADQLSMAGYARKVIAESRATQKSSLPIARDTGAAHRSARDASGWGGPASVLDEHNAVHVLAKRMAEEEGRAVRRAVTRREAAAFARYERDMVRNFDAVLTVTNEDRQHLLALLPEGERDAAAARMSVVPICVDPIRTPPVSRANGGPPTILHMGTMFWPPNVQGVLWFAAEVLPRVRRAVPGARFVIVGKNPPPEVLALADVDPLIEVTGYVADPRPYLAAADAFVVPLHAGGGMRVKILDAWMWGLPVVSTAIGAEGIEVRDGENILLTRTAGAPIEPDEPGSHATEEGQREAFAFAVATTRLLTDPALNQSLRRNGRLWVEERYSWQFVYDRIDAIYAGLMQRANGVLA